MWPFDTRPRYLLGIDIGSQSIKLCELKRTKDNRIKLVHFDVAVLPRDAIVGNEIMDHGAVVETLRELVRRNKCKGSHCLVSVSGYSHIQKNISIPEMTLEEYRESLQWEAEQYIPFEIKDVHVDGQILDPKIGQGLMNALLVAVKKTVVRDYTQVATSAGLCPVVVDTDLCACQNAFDLNYGCSSNETIALVDVGASGINVNVILNGITYFTRYISMGGSLLTEEIMKRFNGCTWAGAEVYKTCPEHLTSTSDVFREVRKIEERVSEALVTEIQRTLDSYAKMTMDNPSHIYLSGGASQSTAFIKALESRLGLPVEIIDPFKKISIDTRQFSPEVLKAARPIASVAVGLALRYKGDDSKIGGGDVRINFIRKMNESRFRGPRFIRLPWRFAFRIPFTTLVFEVNLSSGWRKY